MKENRSMWMKKVWKYAIMIALLGMIFSMGTSAQAASSKWTKACGLYKTFLSKNVSKFVPNIGDFQTKNKESFKKSSYFQIVDLDKNGVPELITQHTNAYNMDDLYVFTCKNNKVVRVKGTDGKKAVLNINCNAAGRYVVYVCGRGHLHTEWSAFYQGHEALTSNVYKMQNGKLKVCIYGYRGYLDYNTKIFKINGKNVSEKAYNAEIKKCKATGLVKNDSAHRSSVLGAKTGKVTASIKLNAKSITLTKGKTYQLKLQGTSKKAIWKSSKKTVASVSGSGKVKAKKAGTAKISATLNGKKYTCTVKVKAPK